MNLRLRRCCQESLKEIRRALERGNALQDVLKMAAVAQLFGNPVEQFISLTSFSWKEWGEAVKKCPSTIAKSTCSMICAREMMRHMGDLELYRFWESMDKSFG